LKLYYESDRASFKLQTNLSKVNNSTLIRQNIECNVVVPEQ